MTELIGLISLAIGTFPFYDLESCGRLFSVKIPPKAQAGSNEHFSVYEAETPGSKLVRRIELRARFDKKDSVQLLNVDLREPVALGIKDLETALKLRGVPMGHRSSHLPDRGAYAAFKLPRGELRVGFTDLSMTKADSFSIDVPAGPRAAVSLRRPP